MSRMKKIYSAIALVLLLGGLTAVYVQYADTNVPKQTKISAAEYERMSNIIIAVNKGEMPVSALKDAEAIVEQRPESVSKQALAEYKALK